MKRDYIRHLAEPAYYTPPSGWCTEGRLKAFSYQHTYKVLKEWLLEFPTSEAYNSITRKSWGYYAMVAAVAPKPRRPKKKNCCIVF